MEKFEYMEKYGFEQLVYLYDRNTGLKGAICIHNTTLGPALGGLAYGSMKVKMKQFMM